MKAFIEEFQVSQTVQDFARSLAVPISYSIILRAVNADGDFRLELDTVNFFKNIDSGMDYEIEILIKNKNGEIIEIK